MMTMKRKLSFRYQKALFKGKNSLFLKLYYANLDSYPGQAHLSVVLSPLVDPLLLC